MHIKCSTSDYTTQPANVISSITALFLECIGENIIIPSTEFVDAACLKKLAKINLIYLPQSQFCVR